MDYKKIENEYYIRIDKDEEIIENIRKICQKENINTATFRGIGGCGKIDIQTYVPEKKDFISHVKTGIFELLQIDGNVTPEDDGELFIHAHASFSYIENGEIKLIGGHLKASVVEYTAEIVLYPVASNIHRMVDKKTDITVWKLH